MLLAHVTAPVGGESPLHGEAHHRRAPGHPPRGRAEIDPLPFQSGRRLQAEEHRRRHAQGEGPLRGFPVIGGRGGQMRGRVGQGHQFLGGASESRPAGDVELIGPDAVHQDPVGRPQQPTGAIRLRGAIVGRTAIDVVARLEAAVGALQPGQVGQDAERLVMQVDGGEGGSREGRVAGPGVAPGADRAGDDGPCGKIGRSCGIAVQGRAGQSEQVGQRRIDQTTPAALRKTDAVAPLLLCSGDSRSLRGRDHAGARRVGDGEPGRNRLHDAIGSDDHALRQEGGRAASPRARAEGGAGDDGRAGSGHQERGAQKITTRERGRNSAHPWSS